MLGLAARFWPLLLIASVSQFGCVSARVSDGEIDRHFRAGRYDDAVARLQEGLRAQGEDGRDLLLYLLDLGLTLHTAGKYEESNRAFLQADKVAEIKDYTSLAAEAGTLLTSENAKSYKAEDFENVLISTYLAMNYAAMGAWEDALVEARRVNRKLYLMVTEGKRKYKQNAFAHYLAGAIYEAEGSFNDAYIDYKKAQELAPAFPSIGRDLWRTAWLSGLRDEREKWAEEYKLKEEDFKAAKLLRPDAGKAELIVLYENGISPQKRPNPSFTSLPRFFSRHNPVRAARIEVDGGPGELTAVLHDIEETAIQNLDEKYGGMIAKKIGGVVAKEVVADQIEKNTKSPVLGALARLAFYASDQADLRSWSLLPRDLQIARLTVEPGTHTLRALPVGEKQLGEKTVQVRAGQKVFVVFRYVP